MERGERQFRIKTDGKERKVIRNKAEKTEAMTGQNEMSEAGDSPNEKTDNEIYWEWLCSIPGIYHVHQEVRLRCFDTPYGVWQSSEQELDYLAEKGFGWIEKVRKYRRRATPQKTVYDRAEKGIQFISCESSRYPHRLRKLNNRPYGLFVAGQLPEPESRAVAIVGARMCTRDGKEMAKQLARATAEAGGIVISGGAYGIDGVAQWETLEAGGKSYAVLGCGVDRCYPSSNAALFERLRSQGGVISEYPPGTAPLSSHFPMRNRIISGLSDVVAVVEARRRSGSLITAGFAAEQGRTVMAVPGRPGDSLSEGTNELIAQGAGLILSPETFAEEIFPDYRGRKKKLSRNIALAPAEKLVYSSLGLHAKSVWELEEGTAMSLAALSEALLSLEMKGLVKETDRNFYVRVK